MVRLMERPDAGWFDSGGWNVAISRVPSWALTLAATRVDLELGTVSLRSLDLVTDGEVRVSAPVGEVPILVDGRIVLEVPASASIEIIGPADTPGGFEATDQGSRFIGEGTSTYVVTVASGATLIVQQW